MSWKSISPKELQENPLALLDDWALLTAGDERDWNTMTVSWGGVGVLWSRPVTFTFVRPQRHTLGFMEASERHTLSFFGPEWHDALSLAGTVSGRDHDKAAETGLKPLLTEGGMSFEQARLVIVSRKLYVQDLTPECFVDPSLEAFYPQKDYHRLYIGEIEKVLVKA